MFGNLQKMPGKGLNKFIDQTSTNCNSFTKNHFYKFIKESSERYFIVDGDYIKKQKIV